MKDHGRAFWIGLALGTAVMGVGLFGLLDGTRLASARDVVTWVIGADLLHDLVVAPLVCLIGLGLARAVPLPWRRPLQWGIMTTALVVAVGFPALAGYGRDRVPGNETVLPLRYGTAVGTVVGVIWALAAVWAASIARRRRRQRSGASPSPQIASDSPSTAPDESSARTAT